MNIAVIGCGYWGQHILRNFNTSELWNLKIACDRDPNQLLKIKKFLPYIETTVDINKILNDASINAVAIATPVDTHFEIAMSVLNSDKHCWVEKPITSDFAQAEELNLLAKKKNLILNVDHTFIYTPAVRKIKELVSSGELGEILYFDSVRINLGLFQHDVNVVWDLAPHDISILQYCLGKTPVSVNATGKALLDYSKKNLESLAYVTINFDDGSIAHIHVNWMSPVKIRKIIIGGTKKMLVYDDMEQSEKIKVYNSGVNVKTREDIYEVLVQYRSGDMYSPAVSTREALAEEVTHFYDCIKAGKNTDTDGDLGLKVVKIIESANQSLKENGKLVYL